MMQPVYKPDDVSRMRVKRVPEYALEKKQQSPATSDNRRYWVVTTIACITWMCKQIIARKFLVADLKKEDEAHVGRSGGVNYSSPSLPHLPWIYRSACHMRRGLACHVIGALGS
jgi:hypothetical protein